MNKILKKIPKTSCRNIFFEKENMGLPGSAFRNRKTTTGFTRLVDFRLTKMRNIFARKQKDLFPRRKFTTGFTILYAVIVSSLILALGLGIVAITMKEVKLSGAGRDSQLAFYAADSGSECAMYHDLVKDVFPTSTSETIILSKCNGQGIEATSVGDNVSTATTSFRMFMVDNETNKPCVDVEVIKYMDNSIPPKQKTSIDARGYNTCDANNARRLERGYRVEY